MGDNPLNTLLVGIKDRASQLQAGGLSADDAWTQAIVEGIRCAAEEQAVAPFEEKVIEAVRQAQAKKSGRAVRRSEIIIELHLMGWSRISDWSVWQILSSLEQRMLVGRPAARSRLWSANHKHPPI